MDARQRNEAARDLAAANPEAVTDAAASNPDILKAADYYEQTRIGGGLTFWAALRRGGQATGNMAPILCDLLAGVTLPDATDGVSLLAIAVEAMPTDVEPFRPVSRANLPRLHKVTPDDARTLPALYGRPAVNETAPQLDLPGILEMPSCTPWLLSLFDRAGGRSLAQGRGAPWALRLFVGALLHLPVTDRDNRWRQLAPMETEEVIRWLHPDGWSNRRRDWEKFPTALEELSRLEVYIPGAGGLRPVMVSVIPRQPSDGVVQFVAMVPRAAAHGARID